MTSQVKIAIVALGAFFVLQLAGQWLQYRRAEKILTTITQAVATIDSISHQVDRTLLVDSLQSVQFKREMQQFDSLVALSGHRLDALDLSIQKQQYNVWKLRQTFDSLRVDLPEF